MVDPRTPVLIGAGQLSNRVDQGADVLEPVDLIVEALRRAADDAGAGDAALTGRGCRAHRRPALVALPRPGRPGRRARRRDAQGHVGHGHGRQQPAVAGEPHLPRHPARRRRPRPARRGRGVAHAGWAPDRRASTSTGRCRPTTCPRPPGRSPRCRCPRRASWPAALMMPVQVYPLFEQALRIVRAATSRSTSSPCPSCGPASARWPRQPARVDPAGLHAPRRSARPRPTTA